MKVYGAVCESEVLKQLKFQHPDFLKNEYRFHIYFQLPTIIPGVFRSHLKNSIHA